MRMSVRVHMCICARRLRARVCVCHVLMYVGLHNNDVDSQTTPNHINVSFSSFPPFLPSSSAAVPADESVPDAVVPTVKAEESGVAPAPTDVPVSHPQTPTAGSLIAPYCGGVIVRI